MRSIRGFFLILFFVAPLKSQELKGFDPKFHGWHWDNFTLAPVPEEVLKRTFIGFSPEWSLGDLAFYEAIKSFGDNGHCLGVALSAAIIFKENGLEGICKPVYLYGNPAPTSSLWRDTILPLVQMLHFRQFGKEFVEYILEVLNFDPNTFVDGSKAYLAVERILSEKKVPIISIFSRRFRSDGHALLAYKLEDNGVQKKIYVYDPNRPYSTDSLWYKNNQNFILIDGDNWRFQFSNTSTGAPILWENGIIFAYPADILAFPQEHIGDMIEDVLSIVVAKADISQVEDGNGNRLFRREIDREPKMEDLERESRIKGFIKFPYMGGKEGIDKEIYLVKRELLKNLKIKLRDRGEGYSFEIFLPDNIVKIEAKKGNQGKDDIILKNLFSDLKEIKIKNSTKTKGRYRLKIYSSLKGDKYETLEINDLNLESEKEIAFSFSSNVEHLSFSSNKNLNLNLKIYDKERNIDIESNKKVDLIYKTHRGDFIIKEKIKESLK